MKSGETVQEFITRTMTIINQIRILGDPISDYTIVMKVLQSLSSRFDHVVAAIEESKDFHNLSLDELSGSLQAHEA